MNLVPYVILGYDTFFTPKRSMSLSEIIIPFLNPVWASGPREILQYFTCSGSPVQDRGFESLRNFRKGRFQCLGSRAVAKSHADG